MDTGFAEMGWSKPEGYFQSVIDSQEAGLFSAWVALVGDEYAGHVTILWPIWATGSDSPEAHPEIQDLAVIPRFRRRGIASLLLDAAESAGFGRSPLVRIGVGLHPGYRAAHRLYVLRGYVPHGRGVTYKGREVEEGETILFDDDLVLHLEKHRVDEGREFLLGEEPA